MADDLSLAAALADTAADTVATLTATSYTHAIAIDANTGVYDCDSSGFVAFLLSEVAARHLQPILDQTGDRRPFARDFHAFFAALPTTLTHGWRRVPTLAEAGRGDMLAWSVATANDGETGHIAVAAGKPTALPDGCMAVPVYDASATPHLHDTRGEGPDRFRDGVGSGSIHIAVDAGGAPVGVRVGEQVTGFETVPIVIARIEPFSAG